MPEERYWVAVVSAGRYAEERLYARERLSIRYDGSGEDPFEDGQPVALVAATQPPLLFGLGRLSGWSNVRARSDVNITYTHRIFDEPQPWAGALPELGLQRLAPIEFQRLANSVGASRRTDADKSEWFVSVALPIEAPSAAEAVREFWTYIDKLGPRELPAFVWPRGDELGMQAYVLGEATNLDPEEDDD